MIKKSKNYLLVTVALMATFGTIGLSMRHLKRNVKILGGEVIQDFTYPFVVRLIIASGENGLGSCTGTLLSKRILLTAAHCINHPKKLLKLANDIQGKAFKNVSTSFVATHPQAVNPNGKFNYAYDLGVALLTGDFEGVDQFPVLGDPKISYQNVSTITFQAIGYGCSRDDDLKNFACQDVGTKKTFYRKAVPKFIPFEKALDILFYTFDGLEGNILPGDSGGPIFRKSLGGKLALVGVHSYTSRIMKKNSTQVGISAGSLALRTELLMWLKETLPTFERDQLNYER